MAKDPEDPRAPYYLGNLLYDLQPERAIAQWERSRALDPGFARVHRNLAFAYARSRGALSQAAASQEKAVAIEKREPRLYYELDQYLAWTRAPLPTRLARLTESPDTVSSREITAGRLGRVQVLLGRNDDAVVIEAASQYGLEAMALTDRDGVGGIVEAHVKASEIGIKLIAGSEVTVDDGSTIVLLAASREGYGNLSTLITIGRRRSPKGESRVRWREVWAHAPGLIALWGGSRGLLAGEADPFFVAHGLKEAFGDRLYALAVRHRRAEETSRETRLRARAEK